MHKLRAEGMTLRGIAAELTKLGHKMSRQSVKNILAAEGARR
jgi:hypothetical protein